MCRKRIGARRGLLGGAAPIGAFRPPPLQPPSRRDTGLWLGPVTRGAFCWCALCTGAGDSGSQEKQEKPLRRDRENFKRGLVHVHPNQLLLEWNGRSGGALALFFQVEPGWSICVDPV